MPPAAIQRQAVSSQGSSADTSMLSPVIGLQKEFSSNIKAGSTCVFPFCLFAHFTSEILPAVHRLVVGINILSIVCEQISEQMEKLSFETVSGSFHGVECGGSKNGTFFSFLNNIHTNFCVWALSFAAFGCFILGKFSKVTEIRFIQFNSISKL